MSTKISAEQFFAAFEAEWQAITSDPSIKGDTPFQDKTAWTTLIQAPGGFLNRVMDRLSSDERPLYYRTEWFRVDALFLGGEDLYGKDHSWPSALDVLIEHEFGEALEEEMWKLIHIRAPLKVIISYDWAEVEKITQSRKEYAENKISALLTMLNKVNSHFPENHETEYLFLLAGREGVKSPIFWRKASNNSLQARRP